MVIILITILISVDIITNFINIISEFIDDRKINILPLISEIIILYILLYLFVWKKELNMINRFFKNIKVKERVEDDE
jgi:hypothetical protein